MKSRQILVLLSLTSVLGLFDSAALAQKVNDLPPLPPGVAATAHPMPGKGTGIDATSGNANMTITQYSNGVRQKIVDGNTMTKWPDGAVRVQYADGTEEWKYSNPNVVGRAGSPDGTRVTLFQNGTQYISTPDDTGARTGQVIAPNGATVDIPAPAPGYVNNNTSNPYLPAGTNGSDNPYLTAANANAPPPADNGSPGSNNSALINSLLTPVSPPVYGSALPPYVAGPLIDSLGSTLSSPPSYSTPSTVPMTPVTPTTTNQDCPGM